MKDKIVYLFNLYFKDTTGACANEVVLSQKLFDVFMSLFWGFFLSTAIMGLMYPNFNILMIIGVFYYVTELICTFIFLNTNKKLIKELFKKNLFINSIITAIVALTICPMPILLAFGSPKWILIVMSIIGAIPFIFSLYLLWQWGNGKNETSEINIDGTIYSINKEKQLNDE